MADRYLLESGSPDGYLKEDGTGVLLQDPLTYRNTVLADSPSRYWRLGDAGPTMVALVGTNLSPSNGTATFGVTGLVGDSDTACSFNPASTQDALGSDSGCQTGNGAWSLECWVITTNSGYQVVIGFGRQGVANADTFMATNSGALHFVNSTTSNTFGGSLNDGKRHHIVLTWDGSNMRGYVDGAQVGSAYAYGTFALATGFQGVNLALRSGNWWNGTLDEPAIYNSALSAGQIAAHYAAGVATPSIDLVLSPFAPVVGLSVVGASPTALVLATFAPVVSAANNQTATPPVATLTLSTFAPVVTATANQLATPATLALTLATFAPTIGLVVVGASPTALALTTFAPVIKSTIVGASPPALSLSTFAPSVATTAHQVATPGLIALTLATFAPNVTASDHKLATPPTLALTLTTFAPTVTATAHQTATPPTLTLSLSTFAPTVTTDDHKLVTPGVATLSLSTFAPTVSATAHVVATPPTLALSLTTFAPTVSATAHRVATPATVTLALSTFAPTVLVPVTVTPDVAALLLTGLEPTVFLDIIARPDTLALVLTRYAPDVAAIAIGLPPGLVVTVGMVPGMVADVIMVPGLTASVSLDVVDEMEVSVTWAT